MGKAHIIINIQVHGSLPKKKVNIRVAVRIWDSIFPQRKGGWAPRSLKPWGNTLGNKWKIKIILERSIYTNSSQYRLSISGIGVTLLFLVQVGRTFTKGNLSSALGN